MDFTVYLVDGCLLSKMTLQKKLNSNFKIIASYPALKKYFEKSKNFFIDIILFNSSFKNLQDFELCKILKFKFPKSKLIVSSKEIEKEKMAALSKYGADGFVLESSSSPDFKKIMQIVALGGFWANYECEKNEILKNQKAKDEIYTEKKNLNKNRLTRREMEVLRLLAQGKTNTQIAREIIVSKNTAKAHVGNILTKLSVKDRVQAAVKAVKAHIL